MHARSGNTALLPAVSTTTTAAQASTPQALLQPTALRIFIVSQASRSYAHTTLDSLRTRQPTTHDDEVGAALVKRWLAQQRALRATAAAPTTMPTEDARTKAKRKQTYNAHSRKTTISLLSSSSLPRPLADGHWLRFPQSLPPLSGSLSTATQPPSRKCLCGCSRRVCSRSFPHLPCDVAAARYLFNSWAVVMPATTSKHDTVTPIPF